MKRTILIISSLLLTYGGLSAQYKVKSPKEIVEERIETYNRLYSLSEQQYTQIKKLMTKQVQLLEKLNKYRPSDSPWTRVNQELIAVNDDIKNALTDEQKERKQKVAEDSFVNKKNAKTLGEEKKSQKTEDSKNTKDSKSDDTDTDNSDTNQDF